MGTVQEAKKRLSIYFPKYPDTSLLEVLKTYLEVRKLRK